jgi:hypothetical protein
VRAAKFGDAAQKYIGPQSKTPSRLIEEFPLLDANRGQAAAGTGVKDRFAKEFSIGGVNQCVRRQNFVEGGKLLSGSEEQGSLAEFETLLLHISLNFVDCTISKVSRLLPHARNEFARFVERQFRRGVVRLAKLIGKCLDEVRSCTRQNAKGPILHGDRNQRSPPRMHSKTKRCLFH